MLSLMPNGDICYLQKPTSDLRPGNNTSRWTLRALEESRLGVFVGSGSIETLHQMTVTAGRGPTERMPFRACSDVQKPTILEHGYRILFRIATAREYIGTFVR